MITLRRAALGTLATAGLLLTPAVAAAGPVSGPPEGGTHTDASANSMLTLSVQGADSERSSAVLTCDPAGGNHPDPNNACRALNNSDGKPGKVATEETRCTMEYAPVTATATGDWNGKPVRFQHEYPNLCTMHAKTSKIFQL